MSVNYIELFNRFSCKKIAGRYINSIHIENCLASIPIQKHIVGYSVLQAPITLYMLGNGDSKILMWSQMHGNESTTTKAVIDLMYFLSSSTDCAQEILNNCTLYIIPQLNPDGANAYTRVNANSIDLNRDAKDLTQPESIILRAIYNKIKPHFCFNLHDQRTMYNVGNSALPATVSFLSPSQNTERAITHTRKIAMQLIVAMNKELQNHIPNQIGRYNDTFNDNCVGDTFQMLETPTILFEAGHYNNDYTREKTRAFIFYALIKAITTITNKTINKYKWNDYLDIPENKQQFFDILIKSTKKDIGITYKEILQNQDVIFIPEVVKTGKLEHFYGHEVFNLNNFEQLNLLKKNVELCEIVKKYL